MRADLIAAFMLLTRLPVSRLGRLGDAHDAAHAVWAYPLVGALLGALGGAVFWLGARAGLPPMLSALWTVAALLLLTGGLHEDGAADTADGLGGGRNAAHKLEIMRDSRIGSFGALALVLALATRVAALATLAQPVHVIPALVVAGMLPRAGMAALLALLRPARRDGLAAGLGRVSGRRVVIGCAVAAVGTHALLPPLLALAAIGAAGVAVAWIGTLAHRQIGGHTGDILGAACVLAECAVLSVLAAGM